MKIIISIISCQNILLAFLFTIKGLFKNSVLRFLMEIFCSWLFQRLRISLFLQKNYLIQLQIYSQSIFVEKTTTNYINKIKITKLTYVINLSNRYNFNFFFPDPGHFFGEIRAFSAENHNPGTPLISKYPHGPLLSVKNVMSRVYK